MSQNLRVVKAENANAVPQYCSIISPELAEVIRLIVREEMQAIQMDRRRALLAEVDSIERRVGLKTK